MSVWISERARGAAGRLPSVRWCIRQPRSAGHSGRHTPKKVYQSNASSRTLFQCFVGRPVLNVAFIRIFVQLLNKTFEKKTLQKLKLNLPDRALLASISSLVSQRARTPLDLPLQFAVAGKKREAFSLASTLRHTHCNLK